VVPLAQVILRAADQRQPLSAPGEGRPAFSLASQMLRFSIWAALAAMMWQTLQYYPLWYLHKVCGQQGEVTAIFAGMRLVTQAVLVVAVAVVTVVQTAVTKIWEAHGREHADRQLLLAFKATALLLIVASAIMALLSSVLVRIYPAGYAAGADIIPALLLTFLVCAHLLFLAIHFTLIEKPRQVFLPWCLGLMCNAAFGSWLIQPGLAPHAALVAAARAGVLGITPALLLCVALLRAERRPFDFGTWLLLIVTYALALPMSLMLPVIALAALLAGSTAMVFSHDEKQQLRNYLTAGRDNLRRLLSLIVG